MRIATVHVDAISVRANGFGAIPAGLVGGTVSIEFLDPAWEGLTKTAVFRGAATRDVLNVGDSIVIPHEVLAKPKKDIWLGFYGTDSNHTLVIPTIWCRLGVTVAAADPSGDVSADPALPVWAQLQEQINNLNGSGNGKPGDSGATFVPHVDAAGNLSWTNDKGLPNPDPVSIRGPAGPAPVKGTDYFTAEDQRSFVQQVLNALPAWEGGSY